VFAQQHRLEPPQIAPAVLDALLAYAWPGNVRELKNVVERMVLRCGHGQILAQHLPPEVLAAATPPAPEPTYASVPHASRVSQFLDRMLNQKESFWTVVYPAFMARDITRDDLRFIVRTGLEQTRGSYRLLLELFNMTPDDYKRFLGFLRQHDCHLPFQRFRMLKGGSERLRTASRAPSA